MQRANDVVACGVADDVDDVGNIQGSVEGVGCAGSEGGGGKDNPTSSPPPPPRPFPAKVQAAPRRMFSVGLPPSN